MNKPRVIEALNDPNAGEALRQLAIRLKAEGVSQVAISASSPNSSRRSMATTLAMTRLLTIWT